MKLISANAARNLSRSSEPSEVNRWLELASLFISNSAKKALQQAVIEMHRNPNVQEEVEKELEANGYRVIRDEESYEIIITWSK